MVLDINNQVLIFNFSLMNETLKPLSVQTKDYKIGFFLGRNVYPRTVVSVSYTIKMQLSVLVWYVYSNWVVITTNET